MDCPVNNAVVYPTNSWPSQLFSVSPERQRCMDKQVSLCTTAASPSRQMHCLSNQVNFPSQTTTTSDCCSPVFTGGYKNPFPKYSPFQPDNGFFFRQDFPEFSFLPACRAIPQSSWTPPVY